MNDAGIVRRPFRGAFTLVELLVVVAIIGVLVTLLLPAVQAAREAGRRTTCSSNVRQLGLALHHLHDHIGRFPAGWSGVAAGRDSAKAADEIPGWGWSAHLLPQIEQEQTFDAIDFHQPILDPIDADVHAAVRVTIVPVFICPSDTSGPTEQSGVFGIGQDDGTDEHDDGQEHDEAGEEGAAHGFHRVDGQELGAVCAVAKSNYVGSFGWSRAIDAFPAEGDGIFYRNSRIGFKNVSDGLSQTILLGERASRLGCSTWLGAINGAEALRSRVVGSVDHSPNSGRHFDDYSSGHPGGIHCVFGDASIRFVADDVDLAILRALSTRSGGEAGARLP